MRFQCFFNNIIMATKFKYRLGMIVYDAMGHDTMQHKIIDKRIGYHNKPQYRLTGLSGWFEERDLKRPVNKKKNFKIRKGTIVYVNNRNRFYIVADRRITPAGNKEYLLVSEKTGNKGWVSESYIHKAN